MGAGISQEQVAAHLSRQEALVRQLQAVVQLQGEVLEKAVAAQDSTAAPSSPGAPDAAAAKGSTTSAVPDDEIGGLERRARQSEHRKHTGEAVDEFEKAQGNITWTEPTADEERGFMATKPWLGAMAPPTGFSFGQSDSIPDKSLELHHVYGYRASGCRNNVIYVDSKTIVYFAAGVAIVHDLSTNTQKFFRGHTDDIVSIAYHPGLKVVATGEQGKVPAIFVWDVKTCQQLAKIAGFHKRAVVSLSFSENGSRIASVGLDDDHSLAVHEWGSGQSLATSKGSADRIVDLQFVGNKTADGNSHLITVGANHIKFWELNGNSLTATKANILEQGGQLQVFLVIAFTSLYTIVGTQGGEMYVFKGRTLFKIIAAHQENLFCLKGGLPGDVVVSGGQDGTVSIWNMASFKRMSQFNMNMQERPEALKTGTIAVRSVDALSPEDIICGTLSGTIYTIKTAGKKIVAVHKSHYGDLSAAQGYGELWGLSVLNRTTVSTAGEDGTLRLWDYTQRKETARLFLNGRAQCVACCPDGNFVAVGLQNGSLSVYRKEGTLLSSSAKVKRRIQSVRFSPSGRLLAAGSADNVIDIYDFDVASGAATYKGRLKGHNSVVLKLDFSEDDKYLQSCSQAYELLFHEVATLSQVTASRSLKDVKWATQTCILGWNVQGIWPLESDGSDVNSVSRSTGGQYLASAEDSGSVKLFRFPCVGGGLDRHGKLVRRPEFVVGTGHSEHVTELAWAQDDAFLFSTGGGDLSLFQWKLKA